MRIRELSPDFTTGAFLEALARYHQGRYQEAAALERTGHSFSAALVRAALGETDTAVDAIARIDRWEYWPTFAVRYFFPEVLDPLRADPRYEAILRGVDRSWGAAAVVP